MQFNEFIQQQIKENSLIPLHQFVSQITLKSCFNTDILKLIIKNQDYDLLYILHTKPFKNYNFDLELFYNTYLQFKDIIKNQKKIFDHYKSQPKEFILSLYVYKINKTITEQTFFDIIQTILKKFDPYYFLQNCSLIGDEKLNNFVIDFIENKISFKLFSLFKKEDQELLELKSKIFVKYYDFEMIDNCIFLIHKNPSLIIHENIQHLCMGFCSSFKTFNFKHDINKIVILSYVIQKQYYKKFLSTLSLDIIDFFNLKEFIHVNEDYSFSITPLINNEIENKLWIIYQNTILKDFTIIKKLTHIELGSFFSLFHDKLNNEQSNTILTILNKNAEESFFDMEDFDLYNSFTYIPRFIHLSILKNKPVNLKDFLINPMESIFLGTLTTLCLDSDSYPIFKTAINFDRFFQTICYSIEHAYTKDTELYKNCLIQHIYNLDDSLFNQLYEKYPNEFMFELIHTKHLLKDF